MRTEWIVGLVAAALVTAACNDAHFGDPVGAPISRAQFPQVGAGLWQSQVTITRYAMGVVRKPPETALRNGCHLPKSLLPTPNGVCTRFAIGQASDGSFVADLDCATGPNRIKGRETFRGDFGKHFTQDLWSEIDVGDGVPPDIDHTETEWTYVGPCPPTMERH